ncbi:MAG: radical SAM protein [Candidatus Helarchaeota archaeon]
MRIRESNIVEKVDNKLRYIKFGLCYPNLYKAGISNYAIQLLYDYLNNIEDIFCERYFFDRQLEPRSIETSRQLRKFDILGFSIQYELDYFNIIKILKAANIPLLSKNRKKPFIIGGGPCILENPIPLNDIFDLFVLGDIEPIFNNFLEIIREKCLSETYKKSIHNYINGFYFPVEGEKEVIKKSTQIDLNSAHHAIKQVIPIDNSVVEDIGFGKSILIECTRGCRGKCNFCLVGWQNNPYRERSTKKIIEIIDETIKVNDVNKISLIGSGISYHNGLTDIIWHVVNSGYRFSLPSLRADKFNQDIAEALYKSNIKQITFAPETGSERLRNIINKNMTNDIIISAIQTAISSGIEKVKLYFMIDLPTEDIEDLKAIITMIDEIIKIGIKKHNLIISINDFIPKPHTPFQWSGISNLEIIRNKIKFLTKELIRRMRIRTTFSDPRWSRIQMILSKGDEKIRKLLNKTYESGMTLGDIRRIINEFNLSFKDMTNEIEIDKELPWDFIDIGIKKKNLINIWKKVRN